jgi:hypothetical protein
MIRFFSYFTLGKAHGWRHFPKCRAGLSYCFLPNPYFRNAQALGLLPHTKTEEGSTVTLIHLFKTDSKRVVEWERYNYGTFKTNMSSTDCLPQHSHWSRQWVNKRETWGRQFGN